jgi:hypothetical protein
MSDAAMSEIATAARRIADVVVLWSDIGLLILKGAADIALSLDAATFSPQDRIAAATISAICLRVGDVLAKRASSGVPS